MNTTTDLASQAAHSDHELDAIRKELETLAPSPRRQIRIKIQELFPYIEKALQRGATQKGALQILKAHGISLSVATFRRVFETERRQREQHEGKSETSNVLGKASTRQELRAVKPAAVTDEQADVSPEANAARSSHDL